MNIEHVPIESVVKLLVAAKYAVENSGDHGCDWCKCWPNCPECESYFRLSAALIPFAEIELPDPFAPETR